MADKTDYAKFSAARQENLGKLVNALRSDPVLLAEFGKTPVDVAKRYELTLGRDEAAKISDLVIANPAVGQIDPGMLEVVTGGGTNTNGCNAWKCA